jgi:hypothetical protein
MVTPNDLKRNLVEMNKARTNNQPIKTFLSQIRIAQAFAKDTKPIPDTFAIRSGQTNLASTVLYTNAVRDWRKLRDAECTL